MKSAFHTVREDRGQPLRAASLVRAFAEHAGLCERLATVAAALKTHYLTGKGWRFRVHDASLTFQQFTNKHQAVKVLIDSNNELARKAGVAVRRNPIVVGVELTAVSAFMRELIRNYLAGRFGHYYLDPRAPREDSLRFISNDKYWVAPHNDHFYDVVFIAPGPLPVKTDPAVVADFMRRILAGLRQDNAGAV
ncbi:MAG: hypothetical protein GF418_02620 [Chitinivibrionales bacterium]|nr:hypothetical protein [Chitinivibrionales bacterium]MBD3394496.1 hypothetical protein [Chitinivibrionales bacterium]